MNQEYINDYPYYTLKYRGFEYTTEFKKSLKENGLDVVGLIDAFLDRGINEYNIKKDNELNLTVNIEQNNIKGTKHDRKN